MNQDWEKLADQVLDFRNYIVSQYNLPETNLLLLQYEVDGFIVRLGPEYTSLWHGILDKISTRPLTLSEAPYRASLDGFLQNLAQEFRTKTAVEGAVPTINPEALKAAQMEMARRVEMAAQHQSNWKQKWQNQIKEYNQKVMENAAVVAELTKLGDPRFKGSDFTAALVETYREDLKKGRREPEQIGLDFQTKQERLALGLPPNASRILVDVYKLIQQQSLIDEAASTAVPTSASLDQAATIATALQVVPALTIMRLSEADISKLAVDMGFALENSPASFGLRFQQQLINYGLAPDVASTFLYRLQQLTGKAQPTTPSGPTTPSSPTSSTPVLNLPSQLGQRLNLFVQDSWLALQRFGQNIFDQLSGLFRFSGSVGIGQAGGAIGSAASSIVNGLFKAASATPSWLNDARNRLSTLSVAGKLIQKTFFQKYGLVLLFVGLVVFFVFGTGFTSLSDQVALAPANQVVPVSGGGGGGDGGTPGICEVPQTGWCSLNNPVTRLGTVFKDQAQNAAIICGRESGWAGAGAANIVNDSCLSGDDPFRHWVDCNATRCPRSLDYSVGLFQINMLAHPAFSEFSAGRWFKENLG